MPEKKKPPYTSGPDITTLFSGIKTQKPPKKVDSEWVRTQNLAAKQHEAIPSLLKWLGIIGDEGAAVASVWDPVRLPQSQAEALEPLVRTAYADVFDQLEVEQADAEQLGAAFVIAYGMGDPARYVRCFLVLCELAGIETGVAKPNAKPSSNGDQPAARREPTQRKPRSDPGAQQQRAPLQQPGGVVVSLSVEIPASWSKDQIRERVLAVSQALSEAKLGAA